MGSVSNHNVMSAAGQKQAVLRVSELEKRSGTGLDYNILQMVRAHGGPIGSWTLYYLLRDLGHSISAPTIGRRLRDLEKRGMLSPATIEGRSLTPAGEEQLKRTEEEQHIQVSAEKLLLSLKSSSRKDLIDQLVVRRAIEGESAALAAQNASSRTVVILQGAIEDQRRAIKHGEAGVDKDIQFHEAIALASGNSVLVSMVHLLRSHPWLNYVIDAIRTKVGGRRIVDHEEIVNAIKLRDAALARQMMDQHITRIIDDVDRYWEQVFSDL